MTFYLHNRFFHNATKFKINAKDSSGDIYSKVKVARRTDRHRYHTRVYNPNAWANQLCNNLLRLRS